MSEIYNQTTDEITDELLSNMPDTYQKTVGFPIRDFMCAIALYVKDIWGEIKTILSWQDIDNMDGDYLTKWCLQRRGISRRVATSATTVLTTTGTGFSISADTIIGESDTGLLFACVNDVVSSDGATDIDVYCTTAGAIGNLPVGAISKIPVTIDGLSSVINNVVASGGYDEESDDSLRERYYEDLQLPIVSGNKNHYRKWALEISGVKDAKVKSLWNGDNTVKVIILDENTLIAGDDLIKEVQDYIDPQDAWGEGVGEAPCGAYCTVATAIQKDITVSATIELKTGYDFDTVKANIKTSLDNYFKEIAFNEDGIVSYAQISNSILQASGVKDHAGMLLNGDTDNIKLSDTDTDTEVAVLTTLDLTNASA